MNGLTIVGLIIDIVGAVALVRTVLFSSDKNIFSSTAGGFGYNHLATSSLIEQKLETVAGLCILIYGFSLQFIGSVNIFLDIKCSLVFLSPLMLLLYFDEQKGEMVIKRMSAIIDSFGPPPPEWEAEVRQYLRGGR